MDSQDPIEHLQETKAALLQFLFEEKSKQEKSRSKLLKIFKGNQENLKGSLKDLLLKLDSNVVELDEYIIKILKAPKINKSEEDPQLRLLNLDPQEAIEEMKNIVPSNSYGDIKMFCSISGEIEKIVEGFIECKLESFFNNKISSMTKTLDNHWEAINSNKSHMEDLKTSINELQNYCKGDNSKSNKDLNNLKEEVKKQSELQNELQNKMGKLTKAGKKSYNYSWYFLLSIIVFILTLICYSKYKYSYSQASPQEDLEEFEYNSAVESKELITSLTQKKTIIIISLKTLEKKQIDLPFDSSSIDGHVFIPTDNSIFFIGSLSNSSYWKKEAFIIDSNKRIKQLGSVHFYGNPALSFFDNYVFAFWSSSLAKYDYQKSIWKTGAVLPYILHYPSSVGFKNHILIVDRDFSKLISYDIIQNSFQEIQSLELRKNTQKVIFSADNRVYIIEFPGDIYRSPENNFTTWKSIGTTSFSCDRILSYVARYNGKFYFKCADDALAECEVQKDLSISVCSLKKI